MKITILIPVIVGVLVVGTVVGLLSTQTWNPSWNPFQPTKERVVERSIEELFDLKSCKIDGQLEADIQATTEQGAQAAKISLEFADAIDASDPKNFKTSGGININLVTEGAEFSLAGETRTFGNDMYIRITTLPAFLPLPVDLGAIKNQWFKIETEKLKEMTKGTSIQAPDEEEAKEILEGLANLLKGKELFDIKKDFGKGHYLVSLRKEGVKELIPEFLQFAKQYVPEGEKSEYEQNLEKTLADFPRKFDNAWKELGGISFEVWIENNTLKQFKWAKEIDLTSLKELKDKIEQGKINLSLDVKFSDFNKKFDIEEPTDSKPIEELIPLETLGLPE